MTSDSARDHRLWDSSFPLRLYHSIWIHFGRRIRKAAKVAVTANPTNMCPMFVNFAVTATLLDGITSLEELITLLEHLRDFASEDPLVGMTQWIGKFLPF